MSTQLDTDLESLEQIFLEESAEDGDACDTTSYGRPCDREAVFVIRWRADGRPTPEDRCSCARLTHQCLAHGEEAMGLEHKQLMIVCHKCQGFMVPIHVDKIRRTS